MDFSNEGRGRGVYCFPCFLNEYLPNPPHYTPKVRLHLLKPDEEKVVLLPQSPGLLQVRKVGVVHQLSLQKSLNKPWEVSDVVVTTE